MKNIIEGKRQRIVHISDVQSSCLGMVSDLSTVFYLHFCINCCFEIKNSKAFPSKSALFSSWFSNPFSMVLCYCPSFGSSILSSVDLVSFSDKDIRFLMPRLA